MKCPKCGERELVKAGTTHMGKQRWICKNPRGERPTCYKTTDPTAPYRDQGGRAKAPDANRTFNRKLKPGTKRYIITAAQNATPVHEEFWKALRRAAKDMHAEILVVPLRYKNATSEWTASQENAEWWHDEVSPFLWNTRRRLNANLTLLGDLKTQPTASAPLSGFEAMTGGESGIIGHTKLQLKVVPSPSHKYPKILTTTGA